MEKAVERNHHEVLKLCIMPDGKQRKERNDKVKSKGDKLIERKLDKDPFAKEKRKVNKTYLV